MKKITKSITLLLLFTLISTTLISCGPTGCECIENRNNLYHNDGGLNKRCVDKFGDDIPDNLRGTDAFTAQLLKNYEEDCDE